jgi:flagellar biosynthesis protein FlhB
MSETAQEKTEQATPKRREDSREKGQVARSRDLNTTVMLMLGASSLFIFGEHLIGTLSEVMRQAFQFTRADLEHVTSLGAAIYKLGLEALFGLAPIFVVMFLAAFIGPVALAGFHISAKSLAPKFSRLNPGKGLKRMFGLNGLVELVKALGKFVLIASFSCLIIYSNLPTLLHLGQLPLIDGLADGARLVAWVFFMASSAMILISLIDVPYQLWDNSKKMKMTKQEVKDEMKETDGRPEVKQQVRKVQHEISQRRMMEAIPDADVVITNPTHYSVALKYDQEGAGAPRLVAKGKDLIALQIQKVARGNDVPVLESPQLARSIFHTTKLNQEIPQGLYVAVAQVLAYVFQVKLHARGKAERPKEPGDDLPIPPELKH